MFVLHISIIKACAHQDMDALTTKTKSCLLSLNCCLQKQGCMRPKKDSVEWMIDWMDGMMKTCLNTGTWKEAKAKENRRGKGGGSQGMSTNVRHCASKERLAKKA